MKLSPLAALVGAIAAHALMAQVIPSFWWVPDVTLVGLVIGIGRSPGRWFILSCAAGLWTMAWAVRFPQLAIAGYLGIGWVIRSVVRHWDIADLRMQYLVCGIASAVTTFGALWVENLWSLAVFGLASVHVAVTCCTVPFARRVLRVDGE